MSFYKQIRGPIRNILGDLCGDSDLAETVTYRKYLGQAFSEEEGHIVDHVVDSTPVAIRLRHSERSAQVASGPVEKGDQYFLFQYESLPNEISLLDKIIDANGKTYSLTSIDKIFGLAITITVDG